MLLWSSTAKEVVMGLCQKIKVELPKTGVMVRRSGKYPTVYKILRSYRNDKGQPTNDRVAIARLDAASGMLIPNDTYYYYFGSKLTSKLVILPKYNSIRSIGAAFLVNNILNSTGLTGILDDCFGALRSSQIRTAVLYMVTNGNVFEGSLEFCEEYTLSEAPISSSIVSELFASITYDERMEFFKKWTSTQLSESYLAYDLTSFSTSTKGIIDSEWGYNRDGDKLPQINLGCFLSEGTSLPVFYVTYPGSIVDKSHLPYMMTYNEELSISRVCFILDRGFCSKYNVQYMVKNNLKFILGFESGHKLINKTIKSVYSDIMSLRNRTQRHNQAMAVKEIFYGEQLILHIFYDAVLVDQQKSDLIRKIDAKEEILAQLSTITESDAKAYKAYFSIDIADDGTFKFSRDFNKIDDLAKKYGYFCLLTNSDFNSSEILTIYRRRDMIEKAFDDVKNYLDMKRLRTHRQETTDGKLFCAFIALIVTSQIGVSLGDMMKEKSWSKNDVIKELEKVRVVFSAGKERLMNPMTKTQRLIYEVFGLSEDNLKTYVSTSADPD
jgi:transposase